MGWGQGRNCAAGAGGPPGPLRLWLVFLIFLLHQREGWNREEHKGRVGDGVVKCSLPASLPIKEEQCLSHPLGWEKHGVGAS